MSDEPKTRWTQPEVLMRKTRDYRAMCKELQKELREAKRTIEEMRYWMRIVHTSVSEWVQDD